MPNTEQFVYAAVYFRQLMLKKDSLLTDAAERYCGHTACPVRQFWINHEVQQFRSGLAAAPVLLQVEGLTLSKLFDAFLYGAGLIHIFRDVGNEDRKLFLSLYDDRPNRAKLLYALNTGLRLLLIPVGNVALIIEQDFGDWLNRHSLARPDVRWHDRLFDVPIDK
jgi:hypothetical protein